MAVVILIPHPDDEIFLLPLLERFSNEPIYFICLTDGQHASDNSLGIRRSAEFEKSISCLNRIGFQAEILLFHSAKNIRDGFLHEDFTKDMFSQLQSLVESVNPETIIAPAFEGGHQDHDAVSLLSNLLNNHTEANLIHFSTYRSTTNLLPTFTVMNPIEHGQRVIFGRFRACIIALRMIRIYRSQARTFIFLGFPILRRYIGKAWYTAGNISDLSIDSFLYERRSKALSKDVLGFRSKILNNHHDFE